LSTENQPPPDDPAAWAPIDLRSVLDGTYKVEPPTFMKRTDGVALLYPGKVHSIQGESESGKSMVVHAVIAEALGQGLRVLLLDFESDQGTVINRLKLLGAKPADILANLDYLRPDVSPFDITKELAEWHELLKNRYALAIIDGVTEAFSVFHVKSIDNDEVTTWGRQVPRMIANRTGAAVAVVDHVTKDADSRGRFAIGAQAKMSYLTGTSYTVEVVAPIGVGMSGKLALRVGKDRPGLVRPYGGQWRKSDRTQEIAVAVIDSTNGPNIHYSLEPPRTDAQGVERTRIDQTMADVAQALTDATGPLTFRTLNTVIRGRQENIREALNTLEADGYIRVENGAKNSKQHHLLKPYPEPDTQKLKIAV
jgi:hypothetical protein